MKKWSSRAIKTFFYDYHHKKTQKSSFWESEVIDNQVPVTFQLLTFHRDVFPTKLLSAINSEIILSYLEGHKFSTGNLIFNHNIDMECWSGELFSCYIRFLIRFSCMPALILRERSSNEWDMSCTTSFFLKCKRSSSFD